MSFLNNLDWFGKSLVALVSLLPLLILFNSFVKCGAKPEAIIFVWFLGAVLGIILIPLGVGIMNVPNFVLGDLAPTRTLCILLVLGMTFGTIANLLLGQAIPEAPNPAFPFAIVGSAGAVGYIIVYFISHVAPRHFDAITFSWVNFLGIVLLATAIGMIMYKPLP